MFSYQSTSAAKSSAFFRPNCVPFFSTLKPTVDALLEGLAIDVDKELQLIVKCNNNAQSVEQKPAKR